MKADEGRSTVHPGHVGVVNVDFPSDNHTRLQQETTSDKQNNRPG